jgi:hypothetical protein
MIHDVHAFVTVRVKCGNIEADSHEAAVARAREFFDSLYALFESPNFKQIPDGISAIEFAEEISHFLVDEANDADFDRSTWHDALGQEQWRVEMRFVDRWDDPEWTQDGKPQVFNSYDDASAAIDAFLADVQAAVERGDMTDGYDRDDFRIVPFQSVDRRLAHVETWRCRLCGDYVLPVDFREHLTLHSPNAQNMEAADIVAQYERRSE